MNYITHTKKVVLLAYSKMTMFREQYICIILSKSFLSTHRPFIRQSEHLTALLMKQGHMFEAHILQFLP